MAGMARIECVGKRGDGFDHPRDGGKGRDLGTSTGCGHHGKAGGAEGPLAPDGWLR